MKLSIFFCQKESGMLYLFIAKKISPSWDQISLQLIFGFDNLIRLCVGRYKLTVLFRTVVFFRLRKSSNRWRMQNVRRALVCAKRDNKHHILVMQSTHIRSSFHKFLQMNTFHNLFLQKHVVHRFSELCETWKYYCRCMHSCVCGVLLGKKK